MSSERSPATHPTKYDAKSFWKHLDIEKKKEYLHIDTLYNRQFLEKSRALFFGAVSGLTFSLLLFRIKNRFLLAGITSGLSCAVLCQLKSSPLHSQYFRVWDRVKNDKEVIENIVSSCENISNTELQYFYQKNLKFFMSQLNIDTDSEKVCKSCTK